jgi:hypothetical protein
LLAELSRPDRVTVLREMVRRSSYRVDPEVVAVAILERLRPGELLPEPHGSAEARTRPPARPDSGDVLESL